MTLYTYIVLLAGKYVGHCDYVTADRERLLEEIASNPTHLHGALLSYTVLELKTL